jgi:glycogen operon protein
LSELGYRLAGSSDLYQRDGRHPTASINFVTAHDGFTLHDLVSYNQKHNEANGEGNRDGHNENESWNHGAEGPTQDPGIQQIRERQKRNFMATLLLSQGVPMICGGDEIGRTQRGNNNAYCQDNEISWYDWNLDESKQALLDFTRQLISMRREHPNLRRKKYFQDRAIAPSTVGRTEVGGRAVQDITWVRPDGNEMTQEEWSLGWVRCLGLELCGTTLDHVDALGQPLIDDTFLILFNPHWEPIDFYMPKEHGDAGWRVLFDTRTSEPVASTIVPAGQSYQVVPRSLVLLCEVRAGVTVS